MKKQSKPLDHGTDVQPDEVFDVLRSHMLVDGFHLVMDLEKSKGSWIVDARDGRQYLDFYTFFATTPLGHNHPRLREPAFQRRLGAIAVNKPANSDIYTTAFAEWVAHLRRATRRPRGPAPPVLDRRRLPGRGERPEGRLRLEGAQEPAARAGAKRAPR